MTGEVRMSGGFNGSARSAMSPGTLRLVAQLEQAQERRDAQEAAKREAAKQEFQARSEQLAVQQAIEQGEAMRDALTGRGVGRTHGEFLSMVSAQMDLQDAQDQARERAAYQRWQAQHNADVSVPTSEIEFESARTKAYVEEWRPRLAALKRARRDAQKIAEAVSRRGRR